MLRKQIVTALAIALGSTACVALEVDVPRVCARQSNVHMGAQSGGTTTEQQSFDFDGIGSLSDLGGTELDAAMSLHDIKLIAADTMADLDFIHEAHARIEVDGSSLEPIEIGCAGANCRSTVRELELSPASITNIGDYLHANGMKISVGVTGDLPTESWSLNVELCVAAEATLERGL